MQIDIQSDIDRVTRSLSRISRELVPKAVVPALNRGIDKSYSLSVKYASRDFGRRQKDIRIKKIVTRIRARRGDWSAVVYFNKYLEQMTVDRFYTEADANSPNAVPPRGKQVKGRAFTFTPIRGNSNAEIWAKRERSKRRVDNTWKSSKLHPLRYRRTVRNADRVSRIFAIKGQRVFNQRFIHEINRRLQRAGLA